MGLPLKESRTVRELAEALYDFHPGSGSAMWKGHVSFRSVAEKVGVGNFWQPGSKLPMITALLERTLELRRGRFEPFMLEIVRGGLTYRQKNGKAVTSEEIETINGLILEIGFKFPDLWDPDFHASLRADATVRASERIEQARVAERLSESNRTQRSRELEDSRKSSWHSTKIQIGNVRACNLRRYSTVFSRSTISRLGSRSELSENRSTGRSSWTTRCISWKPSGNRIRAPQPIFIYSARRLKVNPSSHAGYSCLLMVLAGKLQML